MKPMKRLKQNPQKTQGNNVELTQKEKLLMEELDQYRDLIYNGLHEPGLDRWDAFVFLSCLFMGGVLLGEFIWAQHLDHLTASNEVHALFNKEPLRYPVLASYAPDTVQAIKSDLEEASAALENGSTHAADRLIHRAKVRLR
jgi:hypothetical protein